MKSIGIIGLGKMGILHSGILNSQPDVKIVAICENHSLMMRFAKSILPREIKFYGNHLEMISAVELDAVVITTPINTHIPLVLDLAKANRDLSVFVEKPLASTGSQAQAACDAVKDLRGIHMVGFQKRFSPVFQRAKKLLSDGELGEPLFFRAYTFSSDVLHESSAWRFKSGGGVLLDLAPHLLDLLLWFFGMPESVLAVRERIYSRQVDDYVHATLSFPSGVKGHMDACWCMPDFRLPEIMIEVYGKRGSFTVTDDVLKVDVDRDGKRTRETYYKQSFDVPISYLLADPEFTLQDENFIRSFSEKKLPETNFHESSKVNFIIDQIVSQSALETQGARR
jgi:predicted dehydrogenase